MHDIPINITVWLALLTTTSHSTCDTPHLTPPPPQEPRTQTQIHQIGASFAFLNMHQHTLSVMCVRNVCLVWWNVRRVEGVHCALNRFEVMYATNRDSNPHYTHPRTYPKTAMHSIYVQHMALSGRRHKTASKHIHVRTPHPPPHGYIYYDLIYIRNNPNAFPTIGLVRMAHGWV